jgi:hypothetical protein
MMNTLSEIPGGYFNEFIGQETHVERKSWPERFARAEWGPAFAEKFTLGSSECENKQKVEFTCVYCIFS